MLRIKDYDKFEGCTQGEWVRKYEGVPEIWANGLNIITIDDIYPPGDEGTHPEVEANANLVESSPSLLADHKEMRELIKVLAEALEDGFCHLDKIDEIHTSPQVIDKIDSALAKVKEFKGGTNATEN